MTTKIDLSATNLFALSVGETVIVKLRQRGADLPAYGATAKLVKSTEPGRGLIVTYRFGERGPYTYVEVELWISDSYAHVQVEMRRLYPRVGFPVTNHRYHVWGVHVTCEPRKYAVEIDAGLSTALESRELNSAFRETS